MSLKGTLATMPVDDVFDWLCRRGSRGALHLERGPAKRGFDIEDGAVRAARSNLPTEGLGHLLMSRQLMDEHILREAIQTQYHTRVPLGRVLVTIGAIDENVLRGILETKIRESVCEAMCWTEGAFSFDERAERPEWDLEVAVPLTDALVVARAEVERRRQIRRALPTDDVSLWIAHRALLPDDTSTRATRMIQAIDAGHSVDVVALQMGGSRVEALDLIAALCEAGAARIERRKTRREAPDSALDAQGLGAAARGRAAGGDRAGAFELARRATDSAPDHAELRALYHSLERSLLAELSRDLLAGFRVPRLLVDRDAVASLELDEVEERVLSRIDGRWDLLSLIQVTPLSEVEVLMACKRLAARGIISL